MKPNYVQRLRFKFSKVGPTRFIGHLDLARTLERSINRAQIPLAYTQGFNRRPRLQLATPLPLGFTSDCEVADIWLLKRINPEFAKQAMEPKMAPGIYLRSVTEVDLKSPALQTLLAETVYIVTLLESPNKRVVDARIKQLMVSTSVTRARRGRVYDLRPLILDLSLVDLTKESTQLKMRLSLLPGKTGRPDEVLEELGLDPHAALIHRTELVLADLT